MLKHINSSDLYSGKYISQHLENKILIYSLITIIFSRGVGMQS